MRKSRVFEVNLGAEVSLIFSSLRRAGISQRAENLMARRMREELREMLGQIVRDAAADGSFPNRSGRTLRNTVGGARAFGTTFGNLRGHIVGPSYLKLLEEGGEHLPYDAEALAIPLPPVALRPDGTPRLYGPRSWQNVQKTFIYKSKKTGKAYIAYKGGDGRLVLLYMLIEAAEFKARRFLATAWDKRKDDLVQAFGQIMLAEISNIDLLKLARVKGRRS